MSLQSNPARIRAALVSLATTLLVTENATAQTCAVNVQRTLVTSSVSAPVDIRNAGDDRLFIVEQGGTIRILANGAVLPTPFLNLTSIVASGGERGLLSLAFHPSYPATPWFFVYYTNNDPAAGSVGDVIIARYSVSSDPNVANSASAHVLIQVPHSLASNHNGGQLQFGPDGFLYVSIGDGGGGCDSTGPMCNAQRTDTRLGKLLRIDVNTDVPPFYTIPASNPFAGSGSPLNEVWAKGLRNPFRMSFDRQNGDLWIGDVGQDSREEVDFQPAGAPGGRNYGWPVMEGTACGTCSTACPAPVIACSSPPVTLPVHEYDHSIGNVIIGGYVYRGTKIPSLRGCYLFADEGAGHAIWSIDPASPITRRTLDGNVTALTTFGEDRTGEIYFAASGGIYKLSSVASVPATSTAFGVALMLVLTGLATVIVRRRPSRGASQSP
jgi:glucose/arabinose dehydrogenase